MAMVLTNARVYTADAGRPLADTVVVEDGVITYVGERGTPPDARELTVYDLGGRTVIPGIVDAHTGGHPTPTTPQMCHAGRQHRVGQHRRPAILDQHRRVPQPA